MDTIDNELSSQYETCLPVQLGSWTRPWDISSDSA